MQHDQNCFPVNVSELTAQAELLEPRRLLAAGDLDPTFSGDGRQTIDLGDRAVAYATVVQSDGKIVVAGQASSLTDTTSDAVLIRFNHTGTLDTTFGSGGVARFDRGGNETFRDLAILDGDRIVAGGNNSNSGWILARYTANGQLDTASGFGGGDGIRTGGGQITEVALQSGRILTADGRTVVRRHNFSSGSLDTTFGSNGSVVIHSGTFSSLPGFGGLSDMTVQSDGKIVIVGVADGDPNMAPDVVPNAVYAIGRLTASGAPDGSFGTEGGVRVALDNDSSRADAVAVRPSDGAIFVAGIDGGPDANLLRLSSSGQLTHIRQLPSTSSDVMRPSAVLVDVQGRVIVAGTMESPDFNTNGTEDFWIVRFTQDLSARDAAFSGDGEASVDFTADAPPSIYDDHLGGAALGPNGNLLLVGTARDNDGARPTLIALARMIASDPGGLPGVTLTNDGTLSFQGSEVADELAVWNDGAGGIVVWLNGKTQTFAASKVQRLSLSGNGGNDVLEMHHLLQVGGHLNGGFGNDRLTGGASVDTLFGGEGDDHLDGGRGSDIIQGAGGSRDVADYSTRTANLTIGIGTVRDDGEAGENDLVYQDVERVIGGSGNDRIGGSSANNVLYGGGGNDTLSGHGGADALFGMGGDDLLEGSSGNDYFEGGSGHDRLFGGSGADTLFGNSGNDRFFTDGDGVRDVLDGGSDSDSGDVDALDDVTSVETRT